MVRRWPCRRDTGCMGDGGGYHNGKGWGDQREDGKVHWRSRCSETQGRWRRTRGWRGLERVERTSEMQGCIESKIAF